LISGRDKIVNQNFDLFSDRVARAIDKGVIAFQPGDMSALHTRMWMYGHTPIQPLHSVAYPMLINLLTGSD
jgi:hypothetical protein